MATLSSVLLEDGFGDESGLGLGRGGQLGISPSRLMTIFSPVIY
jgi:hypothetical protein